MASGEKYPLSDIEEVLLRIERSGEVNPVKGDIPDIEWPSEELREMSRYTPASVEEYQVWSLTQFYSVDISQSRIGVNKCIFYKRTIKVCVSC